MQANINMPAIMPVKEIRVQTASDFTTFIDNEEGLIDNMNKNNLDPRFLKADGKVLRDQAGRSKEVQLDMKCEGEKYEAYYN